MALSDKPEYPPLLALGFHKMSLGELRKLCVTEFPLSKRRPALMDGFARFVTKVINDGVTGEVWVNGSFLTKKLEPEDVDLVVKSDGLIYDTATLEMKAAIDWIEQDLRPDYYCDSHLLLLYPEGHEMHEYSDWMRSWYHKAYGWSRDNIDTKGIAVIELEAGVLIVME